jgi:hypothetical protein
MPDVIILASNCSLLMTCLLTNCYLNVNYNYFSHVCNGLRVPEVNIIDLGLYFCRSWNVKKGIRHVKPILYVKLLFMVLFFFEIFSR